MIGLLGMPMDSDNTSGKFSLSCPLNFDGEGPTTTTVFAASVKDLRDTINQVVSKPKELITYLHQLFQNRYTKIDGSQDFSWTYMLDSSLRDSLKVCKKTYIAMYGIPVVNLDTALRKIKDGFTAEASLPSDYDFTMKEAFNFFDLNLDAFKAENQHLVNFDGIEPTRRTLVFTAWFADYLATGGGEPEVSIAFCFMFVICITLILDIVCDYILYDDTKTRHLLHNAL
jgi:hypothetical protein